MNILLAVRWVVKAWSMVKAETISKCSRRQVSRLFYGYGISGLNEKTTTLNGQDSCTLEEYVYGEDSIPVSMEFDSDRWDESFLSHLGDDAYDQEDS